MISLNDDIFEQSESPLVDIDENCLYESIFDEYLALESEFNNSNREAFNELTNYEKENIKSNVSRFNHKIRSTMRNYLEKSAFITDHYSRAFMKRYEQDSAIVKPALKSLSKELEEKPKAEVLFVSENVRYQYSNIFKDYIPNPDYMETFVLKKIDLNKIENIKGLTNTDKLEYMEKEYIELVDYIKTGRCYYIARGKVLHTKEEISVEDFPNRIFKAFRSGGKELSSKVTVGDVQDAIARYNKYPAAVEEIKNDFYKAKPKQYKAILRQIDELDMIGSKLWFGTETKSFEEFYTMYIALKYQQLLKLIAIHHQVMSAKLDALTKSYIQDRSTILIAMGISKADTEMFNPIEDVGINEYALFLIESQFNAMNNFMEMNSALGLIDADTEALQEAAFDNLKNFLVNLFGRISETLGKFFNVASEKVTNNAEFLKKNGAIILSDKNAKGATITGLYTYKDITNRLLNDMKFKAITPAEIEEKARAGQWQNVEDYAKDDLKINGFAYKTGEPLKQQLLNYLRGGKIEMSSEHLNKDMRTTMYKYCNAEILQIRQSIEAEKTAIKQFGTTMDQYLATKKNNSKAAVTSTTTQTIQTGTTTTANAEVNSAFTYQDTINTYFNEVDITQNKNPGDSGVKQSLDGDKAEDINKKIINACKSCIKANTTKLSAQLKMSMEVYNAYMKVLKWYVKQINTENANTKKNNKNQTTQNNNKSIGGAIK